MNPNEPIPQEDWLALKERAGLRDSDVARLCSVSPAAVCRWSSVNEAQRRSPPRWVYDVLLSYVEEVEE